MLGALTLLLAFQLAGEAIARLLSLPVPGPVIGLIGLAGSLLAIRPWRAFAQKLNLGEISRVLTTSLGLLFVPAGVGVVQSSDLIGWLPAIVLIIVVSTALTMLATVGTFLLVKRLTSGGLSV